MKSKPDSLDEAGLLRGRAETRLRKLQAKTPTPAGDIRSATDTKRLLHELQVHQIELEMQNEELIKARDEMEAGLEIYSDLYDFAPVAYFNLTPEGNIRQVNLAGAALVGLERSRLTGGSFVRLVAAEYRPAFTTFLRQVQSSQASQSGEFAFWRHDQPHRFVNVEAHCSPSGREYRVAAMDITEHKQVVDKVRVSEVRFRRLFETAHDGILLLDPATRKITDANPLMTIMLGYTHAQLVGKELFEIGLLKDEAASRAMFQRLTKKHEVRYEDLPLESRDGRHQEVEVVANLYQENGHAVIQCNIRDITMRKQTEDALRFSEERYRNLFNSMDEAYCIIEMIFDQHRKPADWRYLAVNPSFGKHSGLRGAVGRRISELVPKLERSWHEIFGKVALTGKPERFISEAKALNRWFDVYAFRLGGRESRRVAVLFSNITERKQVEQALVAARAELARYAGQLEKQVTRRTAELTATNRRLEASVRSITRGKEQYRGLLVEAQVMQKKLRQLTHQILTTQEEERKKISRELHDEVVQTLVSINVELSTLVRGNSVKGHGLKDRIARTQRLVENAVDSVHRFARDLRPPVLDDLGLIPALHAFCLTLAKRRKLKIKLSAFSGVEALSGDKRTVLFRVAQEALSNIARHAHATTAVVSLRKAAGVIRMEISDNGQAFSVKKILRAKNNKRLGLVGMKERVEMVGGTLSIVSVSGKGTTVHAEIPFTSE